MTSTKLQIEINSLPAHLRQKVADFVAFLKTKSAKEKNSLSDDFDDFVSSHHEEIQTLQKITATSQTFDFLNDEEDLYSEEDLKEKYHG